MDYKDCTLFPMTAAAADVICTWEYPPPYAAYSFRGHDDDYLADASTWGSEQFYLTDGQRIVGQAACQLYEGAYWVGWSLAPDLCGKGSGHRFVSRCVEELRRILHIEGTVYLRVAASNLRAVHAYQKAGFAYTETIRDEVAYSGHTEDFYVMKHTKD